MNRKLCACLGALLMLSLTACSPDAATSGSVSQSEQDQSAVSVIAPADSSVEDEVSADQSVEAEDPPAEPFDYSRPVPESSPVDNSYFEDAAFVGDSRTDGFLIYSGIGCGENLTSNGLSIFRLENKKVFKQNGKEYTLIEKLAQKEYGKVYLSLGVNELGYYDDQGFYDAYCSAIDAIRACQPNAVIYIQGLIPLNEKAVAETGGPAFLENDHLRIYNDLMKQAAAEKQVAFLDLYSHFADENGQLPDGASKDGVHLRGEYCKLWLEYLKTHTVEED